jgi:Flp pilus assembly protein TadD
MQGMIDMALLTIEESTKSILRIISTTVVINCICSAQTNKHKRAMGRKVGAEEDVRAVRLKRQKSFYSRGGDAAGTPWAALACSVVTGRHSN